MRKFNENPMASGVMFGLIAFVEVVLHITMFAVSLDMKFDFTTWFNAGVTGAFLLAMVLMGVEFILWPLSYINSEPLSRFFLTWSTVCTWHMTTSFWAGPILMLLGEILQGH